ncbi:MAG: hypothetical protein KDK27_08785 [Leptospiraceae bacterium]|nr:hypothetical protein [Leptospiraceae bacterium]
MINATGPFRVIALYRTIAVCLIPLVLLPYCHTTSTITTEPEGIEVRYKGRTLGKTPFSTEFSDLIFEEDTVQFYHEGEYLRSGRLAREVKVGALIGAILVTIPVFWVAGPKEYYFFEIRMPDEETDATANQAPAQSEQQPTSPASDANSYTTITFDAEGNAIVSDENRSDEPENTAATEAEEYDGLVRLKNGQALENVRVEVQGEHVMVTTPDGTSVFYKKHEIESINFHSD